MRVCHFARDVASFCNLAGPRSDPMPFLDTYRTMCRGFIADKVAVAFTHFDQVKGDNPSKTLVRPCTHK